MKKSAFAWRSLIFAGLVATAFGAAARPPVIRHDPVRAAPKGQAIQIRATVTADQGVNSVTLYYAVSRDAAPFKQAMQDAGAGAFIGTIPASLLDAASEIFYYVEATDRTDAISETPWHRINLRAAAETPPDQPGATSRSWKKPALIAGGIALAGGAAALIAGSQGGDDGGGATTTNTGTFAGTVTTVLDITGESPSVETRPVSFTVVSSGIVTSDNLQPGRHLEGTLRDNAFSMTGRVDDPDKTGEIRYQGALLGSRIVGSLTGSVVTTNGAVGVYSGTFTADKI